MLALTIWQPWASLIMAGAKPFEFRGWPAPAETMGTRIVIHAGARAIKPEDVLDLLNRLDDLKGGTGLVPDLARPILERVRDAHRNSPGLPLASGLGTALLGRSRLVTDMFKGHVADSDRTTHHLWAWPLSVIRPFAHPIPARGAQGLWTWPHELEPDRISAEAGARS
jgi:hypothetical protein